MYLCHIDSQKSSVSVRLVSLMRFSATAKYFGSFSIPIYCRFSMMAATQVVPLPIVLSKITPPHFSIGAYQVAQQIYWLLRRM